MVVLSFLFSVVRDVIRTRVGGTHSLVKYVRVSHAGAVDPTRVVYWGDLVPCRHRRLSEIGRFGSVGRDLGGKVSRVGSSVILFLLGWRCGEVQIFRRELDLGGLARESVGSLRIRMRRGLIWVLMR